MKKPHLEVADIFREYGESFTRKFVSFMSTLKWKVMHAIKICRTAALGGHVDECDKCGHQAVSYNSCRNRHCPKCQTLAKAEWLEARKSELLPVEYYHVVFTIPASLSSIALQNKRVVYNILFQAVSKTLLLIAADPKHLGVEIGFTAILHTWGQNLMHHRARKVQFCRSVLNVKKLVETKNVPNQDWTVRFEALTGKYPLLCPKCKFGRLKCIRNLLPCAVIHPRPPPEILH